jgi:hypothetical protein
MSGARSRCGGRIYEEYCVIAVVIDILYLVPLCKIHRN